VQIEGASAIVTGGASGLGAATARQLAERGMKVVIADLQADAGEALAKEIDGRYMPTDVRDTDQVIATVEAAKELGVLRVLVNCAGIGGAVRTVGREATYETAHSLEDFNRVIGVNLVGTFNCIRLAATAMANNEPQESGERGCIINTASVAAFDGQIGQAAYSASKGGIVGLTLTVARDLAVTGIRVNTIAPGLIDTPIYGEGEAAEEFKTKLARDVLFPKRLGMAAEFASLVAEVASNSYLNAEVIRIDAGARLQPK
jgi:NAD(P)-dependent dehydrogenase (short-subunit alcohol dehydrogenase family)